VRQQGVVEAALYSAGTALAVEEVAQTTGLAPEVVRACLAALAKAYDAAGSAIEVARIGDKWAMQIRADEAGAGVRAAGSRGTSPGGALIAHQPGNRTTSSADGRKGYERVRCS
jgi:chromosome segregation and condensation protein ScpB